MLNRKDEPRYLCSELVDMLWEDCFGATKGSVANLEEISSTEAALFTEDKIEPGAPISFCAKGHCLYGIVESSAFDPYLGWFVRITLAPASRWRGQLFVPEHLFPIGVRHLVAVTEDVTVSAA